MDPSSLPADVQTLLDWWLPRVQGMFGPRMHAAWLFGGTVLGGYTPGHSDVDVCTVVQGGVSQADGQRIAQLHDAMRDRFIGGDTPSRYAYVIEGQYVPPELMTDSQAVGDCYAAYGRTRQALHGNPITPFDRYSLSHHGICLCGQPHRFTPPQRAELRRQLHEDLASLTDPPAGPASSPGWLATMITWTARSIVFWRDGRLLSKTAALEWEIAANSPFQDAYGLALALRTAGRGVYVQHAAELRCRFDHIRLPATDLLRQLARDP